MAQVLLSSNEGIVGVAVVTLPIPDKEYSKTLNDLRELGIGDVRARDCYIDQIMDAPPVLDCLEGQTVNIDELDFLMRSLDRFDDDELAKFQAMAAKREITSVEDLINLSFCSERATVITNFDDLEIVGRRHYMTMQGGGCSTEEYAKLNGVGIARGLISSGEGTVTPYGVVYEDGMQLEELYTGRSFPAYADQPYMMELELAPVLDRPEDRHTTFIFLPMPEERLAERAGYGSVSEITIQSWCSELPEAVNQAMYIPQEDLRLLNSLCEKVAEMSDFQRKTLAAAVRYAQPQGVYQVNRVAEELEQFGFTPGVSNAEEYGRYVIRNSDYLNYDPALDDFYDYEKYGQSRVESEKGQFLAGGYISFKGSISMQELLMEPPSGSEQGGMQMMGF